eukprot:scaffold6354_cov126-Isochrysis_galbana.AAC.15
MALLPGRASISLSHSRALRGPAAARLGGGLVQMSEGAPQPNPIHRPSVDEMSPAKEEPRLGLRRGVSAVPAHRVHARRVGQASLVGALHQEPADHRQVRRELGARDGAELHHGHGRLLRRREHDVSRLPGLHRRHAPGATGKRPGAQHHQAAVSSGLHLLHRHAGAVPAARLPDQHGLLPLERGPHPLGWRHQQLPQRGSAGQHLLPGGRQVGGAQGRACSQHGRVRKGAAQLPTRADGRQGVPQRADGHRPDGQDDRGAGARGPTATRASFFCLTREHRPGVVVRVAASGREHRSRTRPCSRGSAIGSDRDVAALVLLTVNASLFTRRRRPSGVAPTGGCVHRCTDRGLSPHAAGERVHGCQEPPDVHAQRHVVRAAQGRS